MARDLGGGDDAQQGAGLMGGPTWRIVPGDVREGLRSLPAASVQCVVTSPPFFQLRSYDTEPQLWGGDPDCAHLWTDTIPGESRGGSGTPNGRNGRGEQYARGNPRGCYCSRCAGWCGELGNEPTIEQYVANMVEVFREVKRVLRPDGVVWANWGDSYAGSGRGPTGQNGIGNHSERQGFVNNQHLQTAAVESGAIGRSWVPAPRGVKQKDLIGVPWRIAFALQADGWWLRQDIIWSKPNPLPESVQDRCTKAHEYLFLLSKSRTYYYDAAAIAEPSIHAGREVVVTGKGFAGQATGNGVAGTGNAVVGSVVTVADTRNKRSVWEVPTEGYPGAHFATWPVRLVEPCILAGSRPGDTVFDPFTGSGTTAVVALRLGRSFVGCELNPEYVTLARNRINSDSPMFNTTAEVS